jgi:transposase-like protein
VSEAPRGGTVRKRKTIDGKSEYVYRAICECCKALGPECIGSAIGARREARKQEWRCEEKKIRVAMGESWTWIVQCPACRPPSPDSA